MKFAPLVFRNLLRNKRRTILTFLSIAVSIFVFSAATSLPIVVEQLLKPTASSLRIVTQNKAGASFSLLFCLFLTEALLVAAAAGALGCAAAFITLRVLALRISTVGIPPSIIGMTGLVAFESIMAALLLGLCSAALPYGLAVRRSIAGSLRAVG